jgi:cytochrome c oxidase assembly protein subunit 15
MAVPDWPGTYGYNLFLYPWQTWIAGPWDLFIEHGHRLLGALSGMLNIALVLAVFRWDRRVWVRYYSLGALAAVILQGSLGGARVLLDARQLAMLHGCAGPAFFAVCVSLCVVTSRSWNEAVQREPRRRPTGFAAHLTDLRRLTAATAGTAYLQLVIGALMRHIPVTASPNFFRWTVFAHLFFGGLAATLTAAIAWLVFRGRDRLPNLRAAAGSLAALTGVQVVLGCATWVVNYYWPYWVPDWPITAGYAVIEAKGWLQAMIVTAHQAMGSLIVGVSVLLMLRVYRQIRVEPAGHPAGVRLAGGAAA